MATGIPIALAAWWLLRLVGALRRRTVWRALGPRLVALREAAGGELAPVSAGYRLTLPDGAVVRWTFGLRGPRTRWRMPQGAGARAGWVDGDELPLTARD